MAGAPIPLALVGIGKIAWDQHLLAIVADPEFRLVAAVSRNERVERGAGSARGQRGDPARGCVPWPIRIFPWRCCPDTWKVA